MVADSIFNVEVCLWRPIVVLFLKSLTWPQSTIGCSPSYRKIPFSWEFMKLKSDSRIFFFLFSKKFTVVFSFRTLFPKGLGCILWLGALETWHHRTSTFNKEKKMTFSSVFSGSTIESQIYHSRNPVSLQILCHNHTFFFSKQASNKGNPQIIEQIH